MTFQNVRMHINHKLKSQYYHCIEIICNDLWIVTLISSNYFLFRNYKLDKTSRIFDFVVILSTNIIISFLINAN